LGSRHVSAVDGPHKAKQLKHKDHKMMRQLFMQGTVFLAASDIFHFELPGLFELHKDIPWKLLHYRFSGLRGTGTQGATEIERKRPGADFFRLPTPSVPYYLLANPVVFFRCRCGAHVMPTFQMTPRRIQCGCPMILTRWTRRSITYVSVQHKAIEPPH